MTRRDVKAQDRSVFYVRALGNEINSNFGAAVDLRSPRIEDDISLDDDVDFGAEVLNVPKRLLTHGESANKINFISDSCRMSSSGAREGETFVEDFELGPCR